MDPFAKHYINDDCASALPGERVDLGSGSMATATHRYMVAHGCLFRSFAWCDHEICDAPARSPRGEWLAVRGHWKQFKKRAA